MERVYLDANVLFSAVYQSDRPLAKLLDLPDVQYITSPYAAAEAMRNILRKQPKRAPILSRLLGQIGLVQDAVLPDSLAISLPEKDRPILAAAIAASASHLLTGDNHFRELFGRVIQGVLIIRPADFLRLKQR